MGEFELNKRLHLLFTLSITTLYLQFIAYHPCIIVDLALRTIRAKHPHHMC